MDYQVHFLWMSITPVFRFCLSLSFLFLFSSFFVVEWINEWFHIHIYFYETHWIYPKNVPSVSKLFAKWMNLIVEFRKIFIRWLFKLLNSVNRSKEMRQVESRLHIEVEIGNVLKSCPSITWKYNNVFWYSYRQKLLPIKRHKIRDQRRIMHIMVLMNIFLHSNSYK